MSTPSISETADPADLSRFKREILFVHARDAIFALESTLPYGTDARRSLYAVRVQLADTWQAMEPEAKAAPFTEKGGA